MHALLIERGQIIDKLIAIKQRQGGGSAFRPAREASMMRAIVERHTGRLPLDTVEGIWRIIISTFTYVQSPYSVHVDVSRGDAAMRDSARFHFGFTVPCAPHMSAAAVIDAVASAAGDLGMFALDGGPAAGAWWMGLARPDAPKVIARLPFVERPDHPAGMPVFVIAKPLADGGGARRRAGGGDGSTAGAATIRRRSPSSAARSSATPPTAWACRCWWRGRGAQATGRRRRRSPRRGRPTRARQEIGAHAARYDGSKLRPRRG